MFATIYLINGPNLNLLGTREPQTYGHATLKDIEAHMRDLCAKSGVKLIARQSNKEGELVDFIHEAGLAKAGVILNAGAYTHTSIALRDAITASNAHVIEVHLTNVHAREAFRHHSMISAVCQGVILGFGPLSYELALQALLSKPAPFAAPLT